MQKNNSKNKTHLFPVCSFNELDDIPSKEIVLIKKGRPYFAFVVKKAGQVFAYTNACPHQRRMLQMKQDVFLNKDKTYIQCSVHGAEFQIETGLCISGPCDGKELTSLKCEVVNDVVMVSFS